MEELTSRQQFFYDLAKGTMAIQKKPVVSLGEMSRYSKLQGGPNAKGVSPTRLITPMRELMRKGYIDFKKTVPHDVHSYRDVEVMLTDEGEAIYLGEPEVDYTYESVPPEHSLSGIGEVIMNRQTSEPRMVDARNIDYIRQ